MFNQQQPPPTKPAFKFVIKSKIEVPNSTLAIDNKNTEEEKKGSSILDDRKRKRPMNEAPVPKKKIHSQLLKWNKKKEELKHEDATIFEKEQAKNDFADLTSLSCLLCQRKFKTKNDLTRHQELSDLHKNNLKDAVAVNKAKLKLSFLKSEDDEKKEEQTVEYRNRAAERRQAYGQPDKPVLSPPSSPPRQPSRELAALPKASMNIPIADDNKGARMLAQMGWKKGEGLGKDKSGILNPVKAESYAQTAGIGATSKRDLSTGDGSYRSRTLDLVKARQRLNK